MIARARAWRDGSSRGLPLDAARKRKPMRPAMLEAFPAAGLKTGGGSVI